MKAAEVVDTSGIQMDEYVKRQSVRKVLDELKNGHCLNCHSFSGHQAIFRNEKDLICPVCHFTIYEADLKLISQKLNTDAYVHVDVYEQWMKDNREDENG